MKQGPWWGSMPLFLLLSSLTVNTTVSLKRKFLPLCPGLEYSEWTKWMSGSRPRETKSLGKISFPKHLKVWGLTCHGTIYLCWKSEAICTNDSKDRDSAVISKMGTRNTSFCLGMEEQGWGINRRKEYEICKWKWAQSNWLGLNKNSVGDWFKCLQSIRFRNLK